MSWSLLDRLLAMALAASVIDSLTGPSASGFNNKFENNCEANNVNNIELTCASPPNPLPLTEQPRGPSISIAFIWMPRHLQSLRGE